MRERQLTFFVMYLSPLISEVYLFEKPVHNAVRRFSCLYTSLKNHVVGTICIATTCRCNSNEYPQHMLYRVNQKKTSLIINIIKEVLSWYLVGRFIFYHIYPSNFEKPKRSVRYLCRIRYLSSWSFPVVFWSILSCVHGCSMMSMFMFLLLVMTRNGCN